MFSRKKITAVSWLVGGLAATGAGIGHAYAAGPSGDCTRDDAGYVTCRHHSETSYTSGDGTYHVDQKQDCTTVSPAQVNLPESGAEQSGTKQTGTVVNCSNTAPAPSDFRAPDVAPVLARLP